MVSILVSPRCVLPVYVSLPTVLNGSKIQGDKQCIVRAGSDMHQFVTPYSQQGHVRRRA